MPLFRLTGPLLMALGSLQAAPACEAPVAPSLEGAYRLADGSVLSVLPADAPGRWRLTDFRSGRSPLLQAQAADRLLEVDAPPGAPALAVRRDAQGRPQALVLETPGNAPRVAQRLALRERVATVPSAGVSLHARLTLPARATGPLRAVILVHGSDPVPSVGREWLPHWLAAHGLATLVFDKRGTGCSGGQYTQRFDVLADDVVAAAAWLRAQPEVDPRAVGLAGFSQGGWVAPLAAAKDPGIRFVAVAYGLAMSMADEDRLEAPLKLREAGVDEAGLAEFEQLNAALHTLARGGFADWQPLEQLLERFGARPWLAVAARQPSWVGHLLQMGLAQAKAQAPGMFREFFQPFYEPVPTLERLDVPMLWLIAGQDIEAPPGPTLSALHRLQQQGRPIALRVFPDADHGLMEFVVRDGRRVPTRYAPGYFEALRRWLQAPQRGSPQG